MNAYEHLKLRKLIKDNNVYKRFLSFADGAKSAIDLKELEKFERDYMRHHDTLVATIAKNKQQLTK